MLFVIPIIFISPHKIFTLVCALSFPSFCDFVHTFCIFPDAAANSHIHLRGEIGGNLTFRCPVDRSKDIEFFYFQRKDTFINGFYTPNKIPVLPWSNTKLDDKDRTTVHMFNLNASHGGDYDCLIKYKQSDSYNTTVIKVNVKGKNF